MSLSTLAHARRSNYPASAKLHGSGLGLSGGGLGMPGAGVMVGGLGEGHLQDFLIKGIRKYAYNKLKKKAEAEGRTIGAYNDKPPQYDTKEKIANFFTNGRAYRKGMPLTLPTEPTTGAGRGRRKMRGAGWWSDMTNKIKGAFNSANDWLKKTKIISTVAKFIPNPYVKGVGMAAGLLGYGRYHNRVKGYTRKTGAVRKYTRRVPRKKCHCGSGRGCGCR